ncbi:extracellular solute-binding protein [Paenibacillus qinlingensis]|uniref:extracellular solute-binding protein n=1 Tax=Paenibacillus qinlingensis TaxID=1837343 RepID=UPI0015644226|nr:extracellular solute-binding protein [Paenibacillus qinlingensis]NQX59355.1 ABC transporter substrate-binding protein [Paenibacillus qinlingensis]
MSKQMRTRFSVILATTVLVGVIAGCSKETTTAVDTKQPEATASASKEPVVMEWLAYNSFSEPDPDSKVVQMVSEKFNAKFKFWFVDSQKWNDNLNVKLAAGEMPDVMQVRSPVGTYVSNGVLAPIPDETIRKFAPNYAKLIDKYNLWNTVKYEGEIYGLPSLNVNGDYPTVLVWRQDWLTKVGITKTPETIQEFEDALVKIRNNDPDGNGKKDTYGFSDFALPAILGAFGSPGLTEVKSAAVQNKENLIYMEKDGKITFAAIQPEMKEALTLLSKWYKMDLIDPEMITSENTGGYGFDSQAFYNNRIGLTGKGMFYHWRNVIDPANPEDKGGGQYVNLKKSQPNAEIVLGKAPVGPKGASGTPQWGVNSTTLGITVKGAKDPRKVETFLKMIEASATDIEYYKTVFRGWKGEAWKEENGRFINLSASVPAAEFMKKGGQVFNIINVPEFDKSMDKFNYDFGDKVKPKGYLNMAVPSVESHVKYATNLTKLTVQTYFKIILGEASPDIFDDYVKTFKANGGDAIEKEVNEAYKKMLGK